MMTESGKGVPFDSVPLETQIDESAINTAATQIRSRASTLEIFDKTTLLLKAISLIDLTSLAGNDTPATIEALCQKAVLAIPDSILPEANEQQEIIRHTAAVCVYPSRVPDAIESLKKYDPKNKIAIASVAAGFPSGQFPLETRVREVELAVLSGAQEIDIVIDRSLALRHRWEDLYKEIKLFREACGSNVQLKTILATGELHSFDNVYKASMVAMMAGSDFIKTSTGKEAVNATLPVGIVMCKAIKDYYKLYGRKVGFKPAGGIKTAQDALEWITLITSELGHNYMCRDLFRIGASSLLDNIITALQ